jgi:hypothetical protein
MAQPSPAVVQPLSPENAGVTSTSTVAAAAAGSIAAEPPKTHKSHFKPVQVHCGSFSSDAFQGAAIMGVDIAGGGGITVSAGACCKECALLRHCHGWTWVGTGAHEGNCWLKSGVPNLFIQFDATSGGEC